MILAALAAAALAVQGVASNGTDPSIIRDASQAIEAGRLHEARLLIGRAISEGFTGASIERLNADLSFASRRYSEALAGYAHLVASSQKQPHDCENGGISALELGRIDDAKPLLECAVAAGSLSWRAWNARGVLSDFTQDWATADESYARANELAPNEARIVNNQGWSRLLRGDWHSAVPFFERAAAMDPSSPRISNNLELAKEALAAELPRRRFGESDRDWAARLNDAGVAAELLGERHRAVAAFTQALDASPVWYERASNNLERLSDK